MVRMSFSLIITPDDVLQIWPFLADLHIEKLIFMFASAFSDVDTSILRLICHILSTRDDT